MNLEKNLDKKWLVKSENKILGPYNFDQIIDLIRKKQISIIDEIRDTETRWLYVRENPEFKTIVEEMRTEIDSRSESTKTFQGTSSKSTDDVLQKTKTDINPFTDISIEPQDITFTKETITNTAEKNTPIVEKAKVYGVQSDEYVQKKVNTFSSKVLVISLVTFIVSISSIFAYFYVQKRNVLKQEEELALQIKKYRYLGLYQKAVDIFTKLPASNQKKLIPELLEIYPLLESTGLVSADDLKLLKAESGLTPDQKANIEIVSYWLAMQQQNYGQAQEFLIRATTLQPTSFLIKENEALLYLKKGQFLSSYNLFRTIFNQEKSGRYLLGMVQAYYGLSNLEKSQNIKELLSNLEKYTNVYYDYKKELLLAQIVLADELKESVLFKVSKSQFFNTPCMLSNQFTKPNLLPPNSYSWKDLNEIKLVIQKILTSDEYLLFQLHNYLESNELSSATVFLSANLSKVSSPQIREQMNLLLLNAQKRNKEVVAFEKSNQIDMDSELNQLIIALNKIELNPQSNISTHLSFLISKQQIFYKEWIELEQLIAKNSVSELKKYMKDHFVTVQNFSPVFVARNLVN